MDWIDIAFRIAGLVVASAQLYFGLKFRNQPAAPFQERDTSSRDSVEV